MTPAALWAGLLAATAGAVGGQGAATRGRSAERLGGLRVPTGWASDPRRLRPGGFGHALAGLGTGACCLLVVSGPAGWVLAGLVAATVPRVLARVEPVAQRRRRLQLARELPVAVDLLVACLVAGATLDGSLTRVALALDGPTADALGRVAEAIRLGLDPRSAWRPVMDDPGLARLARAAIRSGEIGAPMAVALQRVASDLRATLRIEADAAARRVSVRAVAPLGLCFLPAFVLLGVLPVVWSLAVAAVGPAQ